MMDIGKELQAAFDDGYAARDKEIVRCGECKHKGQSPSGKGQKWCGLHGTHYGIIVTDDWFCADGKRKDGEHDV